MILYLATCDRAKDCGSSGDAADESANFASHPASETEGKRRNVPHDPGFLQSLKGCVICNSDSCKDHIEYVEQRSVSVIVSS